MAPGRRQGRGCWTCRLRRKRCDSVRPVCGSCENLMIACYSGETKPPWMDGSVRQKHMSEKLKRKIKQNAILRRERRLLTHRNQDITAATETNFVSVSALTSPSTSSASDVAEDTPPTDPASPILSTHAVRPITLDSFNSRPEDLQSPFTSVSSAPDPITLSTSSSSSSVLSASPALPIRVELASIMIYLDHVFPFLFPFYQPPLIETGRQWLLGLLCQNDGSFHIAAALSAYFFSIAAQNDDQDTHEECKALVRNKLIEQMDMAIRSIQKTVSTVNHQGAQSLALDKARTMQEITQILIVEVTVRRNVDWRMHATPALVLFDEMFKSHGIAHSGPSFTTLAGALPTTIPAGTPHNKLVPYTADQSALKFFVSLLLFVDVVASTSLGTLPVLQTYHPSLLSPNTPGSVRLETLVGCQNWAIVAIGQISALCAWKHRAKKDGVFSIIILIHLAQPISQALDEGLRHLDVHATHSQPETTNKIRLQGYYSRHNKPIDSISTPNITRIWAHAAKIYLAVSLSGWQSNSPEIQSSIAKVLTLLQTIESPAQLRTLSWPICISGCLALPTQEQDFRHVVGSTGNLSEFGTLLDALRIMETVWMARDAVERDTRDIASALNVLGSPALLV